VVKPDFFQLVFSSRGIADMLSLSSIGATMANLNAGLVARQRLPLPPIDEQERIIHFVSRKTLEVEITISRLEREIELLREYRTRLVADVVTGKLDVREAAARLPDEVPFHTIEGDVDLSDEIEVTDEEVTE
jgi:type I restriction enzyme S subunit